MTRLHVEDANGAYRVSKGGLYAHTHGQSTRFESDHVKGQQAARLGLGSLGLGLHYCRELVRASVSFPLLSEQLLYYRLLDPAPQAGMMALEHFFINLKSSPEQYDVV